jgi:hypothetical protein
MRYVIIMIAICLCFPTNAQTSIPEGQHPIELNKMSTQDQIREIHRMREEGKERNRAEKEKLLKDEGQRNSK